jgi:hypothetical protein
MRAPVEIMSTVLMARDSQNCEKLKSIGIRTQWGFSPLLRHQDDGNCGERRIDRVPDATWIMRHVPNTNWLASETNRSMMYVRCTHRAEVASFGQTGLAGHCNDLCKFADLISIDWA